MGACASVRDVGKTTGNVYSQRRIRCAVYVGWQKIRVRYRVLVCYLLFFKSTTESIHKVLNMRDNNVGIQCGDHAELSLSSEVTIIHTKLCSFFHFTNSGVVFQRFPAYGDEGLMQLWNNRDHLLQKPACTPPF